MVGFVSYLVLLLALGTSVSCKRDFPFMFAVIAGRSFDHMSMLDPVYGTRKKLKFDSSRPVMAMAMDDRRMDVFFVDYYARFSYIKKANIKSEYFEVLLKQEDSIYGIAVDPAEHLIFFTGDSFRSVCVTEYKSKTVKIIATNSYPQRGIAVNTKDKYVYFSDYFKGVVERMNYDGSDRKIIYTSKTASYLIAVNQKSGYIFICSNTVKGRRIKKMKADGSDLEEMDVFKDSPDFKPISIHYSGFILYVLGSHTKSNISDPTKSELVTKNMESTLVNHFKFKEYFSFVVSFDRGIKYDPEKSSICISKINGCSDLCLPKKTGHVCACNEYYRLKSDNKTCEKVMKKSGPTLYGISNEGSSTYITGIDGNPHDYMLREFVEPWIVKVNAYKYQALDINYQDSQIIGFDALDRSLIYISLNGTTKNVKFDKIASSEVYGVAFDWVNRNVYWTDAQMNWVRMCRYDGKFAKTIADQDIEEPHGIAVHPTKGWLFWSDRGSRPKIMRSDLYGNHSYAIVTDKLTRPSAMTIDYDNNILYWTDNKNLMSFNMATNFVTSFDFTPNNVYTGITMYKNYILATGKPVKGKNHGFHLFVHDVDWKISEQQTIFNKNDKPLDQLIMYDESRQKVTKSPCADMRCSDLCTSVPNESTSTSLEAKCSCGEMRYVDPKDNTICTGYNRYMSTPIMYVTKDRICEVDLIYVINNWGHHKCIFVNFFTPDKGIFSSLAFNYLAEVYYIARYSQKDDRDFTKVYKSKTDEAFGQQVFNHVGRIQSMVYDWISGNIYYTDRDQGQIWVADHRGYKKLLITRNRNVSAIELDMNRNKIIWSESYEHESFIMKSDLRGQNIEVFHKQTTIDTYMSIVSMSHDYTHKRLYWVDPDMNSIVFSPIRGETKVTKIVEHNDTSSIYGVTAFKDFVAFTESGQSSTMGFVDGDTGKPIGNTVVLTNITGIKEVVVFTKDNQPLNLEIANLCGVNNGGCEQFCLSGSDENQLCACVNGYHLNFDRKSCDSNLLVEDNFMLFSDYSNNQIYQTNSFNKATIGSGVPVFSALRIPAYHYPNNMAYDYKNKIVFWTDSRSFESFYMYLNGSQLVKRQSYFIHIRNNHKKVINRKTMSYKELFFEGDSQLLYMVSSDFIGNYMISVTNREGTMYASLVNIVGLYGMKVDPSRGYMYVIYWSQNNNVISRFNMDGSGKVDLVKIKGKVIDFDVDFQEEKIYWLGKESSTLWACDLNGSNIKKLANTGFNSKLARIVVHKGRVLLSRALWEYNSIFIYKSNAIKEIKINVTLDIRNMISVGKHTEHLGKTACSLNNGNCTHFCIPMPNMTRNCLCPLEWNNKNKISVNCTSSGVCKDIDIPHGYMNCNSREGSVCDYKCVPGYVKTKSTLECLNGQWQIGPRILCSRVICPTLQAPQNAHVNLQCPVIAMPGVVCYTNCDQGSNHDSGDLKRVCQMNGTWSGNPVKCSREDCVNRFRNGYFVANRYGKITTDKGETASYKCDKGYHAIDHNKYKCNGNGMWNIDVVLLCRRKRCLVSEVIENAMQSCTSLDELGSSCNYICKSGFMMVSGSIQRYCQMNQTWTGQAIVCREDGVVRGRHTMKTSTIVGIVLSVVALLLILAIIFAFVRYDVNPVSTMKSYDVSGAMDRLRGRINVKLSRARTRVLSGAGAAVPTNDPGIETASIPAAANTVLPASAEGYDAPLGLPQQAANFQVPQSRSSVA